MESRKLSLWRAFNLVIKACQFLASKALSYVVCARILAVCFGKTFEKIEILTGKDNFWITLLRFFESSWTCFWSNQKLLEKSSILTVWFKVEFMGEFSKFKVTVKVSSVSNVLLFLMFSGESGWIFFKGFWDAGCWFLSIGLSFLCLLKILS